MVKSLRTTEKMWLRVTNGSLSYPRTDLGICPIRSGANHWSHLYEGPPLHCADAPTFMGSGKRSGSRIDGHTRICSIDETSSS